VERQTFNVPLYLKEWTRLNGNPPLTQATKNVASLETFLTGTPKIADGSEQGWKDTVAVGSGEVLTIRIRWAAQNGDQFPFDATAGPGYVWHCHILEHEDNQMMRPYTVVSSMSFSGLEFAFVLIPVVVAVAVAVPLIFWRLKKRPTKNR